MKNKTGKAMNNENIFPFLKFKCLQKWASTLVENCFPDAGIDQITLRKYNLRGKETPDLAKELRLRSKSHPQFLIIIHLSEKYEHRDRRSELIRAIHGSTIWDEQNYFDLGIDATFLDCLKKPKSADLCEEMMHFSFWCYSAKQHEDFPETNGYIWPLHADQEWDYWLLYPTDKKQLPERQFDSEAIFNGEAYITLKELKLCVEKWGRVEVLCDTGRLPAYTLFPHNGTLIHDDKLKNLGLPEENDTDDEDDDIGEDTGWVRPHQTDLTLYYKRSPDTGAVHKFEYRFIPSSLKKGDDLGKRWVKISDAHRLDLLSDLGHDGGQPASSAEELPGGKVDPAISPLIEWLKPETLNAIHDLWKALSKKQGIKVKQEKANGRNITNWQIGKAELKIFIKSIRAESTLPDFIFNDLTLKYTASREKEGFFCDIVRQMAKKENKRELVAFRDEILYRNIREIMGAK